jgi:hypothetical protein
MQLTTEVLQRVMPKNIKYKVDQKLVDKINSTFSDPVLMEQYRDNLISYTHVMKEGKFKMEQYLDAVRYVGFKVMGDSNIEAYTKTFPARYTYYVANGTSQKDLASHVTSYNKNKLVNLIYEQTLIPTHILNADLYQKSLNHLAYLMLNARSEKVQSDSASSLATQLRAPETKKFELDIGIKESKTLEELRISTSKLVAQQKVMLAEGLMNAKEIAHSTIIEGELDE